MRIFAEGPTGQAAAGGPQLRSALLPVPARQGMGYQSWGPIEGNPGVTPIPSPYPAIPDTGINHVGGGQPVHYSRKQPPEWKPAVYYQRKPASRFHGALDIDNEMPVPARLPNGNFGFEATTNNLMATDRFYTARRPTFTRQKQVGWPMATPSYSWWK